MVMPQSYVSQSIQLNVSNNFHKEKKKQKQNVLNMNIHLFAANE